MQSIAFMVFPGECRFVVAITTTNRLDHGPHHSQSIASLVSLLVLSPRLQQSIATLGSALVLAAPAPAIDCAAGIDAAAVGDASLWWSSPPQTSTTHGSQRCNRLRPGPRAVRGRGGQGPGRSGPGRSGPGRSGGWVGGWGSGRCRGGVGVAGWVDVSAVPGW